MLHLFSPRHIAPAHIANDMLETAAQPEPASAAVPAPCPRECGWFDSSLELRLGLLVQELPHSDLVWRFGGPAAQMSKNTVS